MTEAPHEVFLSVVVEVVDNGGCVWGTIVKVGRGGTNGIYPILRRLNF